jgi:integrase
MYDYFSFLQAHELRWDDIQRGEEQSLVRAYRDYCLDTTGLHRNTVRQRLIYICKFYEYASRQKWIDSLPFGYEEHTVRREGGFLGHLDASGGKAIARDVSPKKHRDLPKFLSKDQIKSLLAAADNPHHQIMIRFGLQTGLRREEIATFPTAYVFDPDRTECTGRNIRIRLDPYDGHGMRTKGSVARDIYISRRLLKDLYHYVVHTRGLRANLSAVKHLNLFLNQQGKPFSDHGKRIERIVRDIGRRAGIEVHPHMLRHTYATHTLCALQRTETKLEPLVFVQHQLGHASIQTTMVYLHLVHERANQAVLAYDDELNDWMEG